MCRVCIVKNKNMNAVKASNYVGEHDSITLTQRQGSKFEDFLAFRYNLIFDYTHDILCQFMYLL